MQRTRARPAMDDLGNVHVAYARGNPDGSCSLIYAHEAMLPVNATQAPSS